MTLVDSLVIFCKAVSSAGVTRHYSGIYLDKTDEN
jgi:hypothetical protein